METASTPEGAGEGSGKQTNGAASASMAGAGDGSPATALCYLERAEVYLTLGDSMAALADALTAFEMKMDSPRVYLVLGEAYMRNNEKDKALATFQAGYERYRDCAKLNQALEACQAAIISKRTWKKVAGVVGGAAAAGLIAGPVIVGVVSLVGFTSAGIAAGSYAAGAMASAAIANGGGIAAGSLIAICQSVGATGAVGAATTAAASAFGGVAGFFASRR
ncbi:hypothetical protein, variant [Aphanomyces invadans]|nr:hypothetical protein, variant [Aphanomyces invadans]ETV93209.1 hypothetical protein, variant [Aphanomyces invadans]|eukprot:XP_008878230.1 hypothetical protein, variant [Aphanomyces invadans]